MLVYVSVHFRGSLFLADDTSTDVKLVLAIVHEDGPNEIIDAEPVLGDQSSRPIITSIAAHACAGELTGIGRESRSIHRNSF